MYYFDKTLMPLEAPHAVAVSTHGTILLNSPRWAACTHPRPSLWYVPCVHAAGNCLEYSKCGWCCLSVDLLWGIKYIYHAVCCCIMLLSFRSPWLYAEGSVSNHMSGSNVMCSKQNTIDFCDVLFESGDMQGTRLNEAKLTKSCCEMHEYPSSETTLALPENEQKTYCCTSIF